MFIPLNLGLINSVDSDVFYPKRVLQQGDPISCYLFILCVGVFSILIFRSVRNKKISGICVACGVLVISHLLFADDSIMVAHARVEGYDKFKGILQIYGDASGQTVNMEKCRIAISPNVDDES